MKTLDIIVANIVIICGALLLLITALFMVPSFNEEHKIIYTLMILIGVCSIGIGLSYIEIVIRDK